MTNTPSPPSFRCSPVTFLLTGFAWLLLASLAGIAIAIGLVNGTPLPGWLKMMHVHGAFLGGLLQLIIGGLLVSMARSSEGTEAYSRSHSTVFLAVNGATIGLLASFATGSMLFAGLAGLLLLGVVLSISKTAWFHVDEELNHPTGAGWIYRTALISLLLGLTAGIAMAFRLVDMYYAHARLLHIHFMVLGFLTVTFVVALHQIVPTLLQRALVNPRVARLALWSLPVGFAVLLEGFVTSTLWLEIVVGGGLVIGVGLCSYNLLLTWIKSGQPGNVSGLAMGANYLPSPPILPIGSLHLVAYTHLAFIGFMTQIICGALSYGLPIVLATTRIPNSKRRELYRAHLEGIMNRWRTAQLGAMSLGTMALTILAALTWSVPLGSVYVQSVVWLAAGLLLASVALFTAKLAWVIGQPPL